MEEKVVCVCVGGGGGGGGGLKRENIDNGTETLPLYLNLSPASSAFFSLCSTVHA